jgi:hypothetical protein
VPAAPAIASLDGEFSQSVASQLCMAVSAALASGQERCGDQDGYVATDQL